MQAYTGFAYVYDEYMDNIPYEEWCEYLVERLKEQGVTPDMEIADLGCGTGTVTQLLDKAGYSCVGIDNAPDMLTIAAEKLYESGQEIVYSLQDMRDFELPYEVDAMVSIADSMNYITSKEDITSVFECVKKGLKPGGVFIFDLKTIHFFRDVLAENTYAENRDDSAFIWDNYYDTETDINELALSLFLPEYPESGIEPDDECPLYRKYQEFHYQRGLTLDDMRTCVADSGMELVAMYDAFTWLPATDSSERVYVVARETHQDNKHYE